MTTKPIQTRQGDVYLIPVKALPKGCTPIHPLDGRCFVLAFGETTGHKYAVSLHTAQMWTSPDGEWYLEVRQPSLMKHEEHAAPTIPPGIYHLASTRIGATRWIMFSDWGVYAIHGLSSPAPDSTKEHPKS